MVPVLQALAGTCPPAGARRFAHGGNGALNCALPRHPRSVGLKLCLFRALRQRGIPCWGCIWGFQRRKSGILASPGLRAERFQEQENAIWNGQS